MSTSFMDETQDLGSQVVSGAVESVWSGMEIERESFETSKFGTEMVKVETKSDLGSEKQVNLRAEIDTSAPFESVKEAVSRFGGIGYWRPVCNKLVEHEHEVEEISIAKLEEQASQLENDLKLKQRETLDILQELESTRTFVEELKVNLQKEVSEVSGITPNTKFDDMYTNPAAEDDENNKENNGCPQSQFLNFVEGLMQAQRNLTRTTNGIAGIRASIEVFNKKLEKDRLSLAKTRERLTQNSFKMSSIEEQLNQTKQKLQVVKDPDIEDGSEILKELQILHSEAEKFKQMGDAAKLEILRTISKIERKKAKIRTAEIRLVAAAKMKQAARVAEAVALADSKNSWNHQTESGEYKSLQQQKQQLDNGNASKMEILKRVKEATKEIKSTKLALEETLNSMEAAKGEKVAVEEALQQWSSEHDKNMALESCPIAISGPKLVIHESTPVLKPTLSIGQILSRKLFLQEEFMSGTRMLAEKGPMKRGVSLAQMLGKQNRDMPQCRKAERESDQKQRTRKRKKSGFARFSLFLAKQTEQKRKKPTPNLK